MAKTAKQDKITIGIVLDRSGSMIGLRDDTIGGFNVFLADAKKNFGKSKLTLVQFDHEYTVVESNTPIEDVEPLTRVTYAPRGQTALLDAVGQTIATLSGAKTKKKLVVIITDGHENSSREWTSGRIKSLIHEKTAEGWEFVYLGADITATDYAVQTLGIRPETAALATRGASRFGAVTTSFRCYGSADYAPDSLVVDDEKPE